MRFERRRGRASTVLLLAAAVAACSRGVRKPGGHPNEKLGAPEYRHDASVSRFALGDSPKRVSEYGFTKLVGSQGVIAMDEKNGATWGVMNADAAPLRVPALTDDASEHTKVVLRYFHDAGIPKDQVGGAHVTTLMQGSGETAAGASGMQRRRLVAYSTVLERVAGGVPVADSFAWAAFNRNREVIAEGVYWPAIPADVVADARELKARMDDPKSRERFRAGLADAQSLGTSEGKVVIRHSSAADRGDFVAFASYDVLVTPPPGQGRGHIRHFDVNGRERFLVAPAVPSNRPPRRPSPASPGRVR